MNQEPVLSLLGKIFGLSPQTLPERQHYVNSRSFHPANEDLSFLELLAESAFSTTRSSFILGTPNAMSSEETPASKPGDEAKKTKDTSSPEPGSDQPLLQNGISQCHIQDTRDALDMLTMDWIRLDMADWKALQNLCHIVPSASNGFQNLGHSLQEQLTQSHYKSLGISKGLQQMLEQAYKMQRPLRVDLTENTSVILRLGKNGLVSAEFLPNSEAAELFFRQNLQELRNRLESKQLPYGEIIIRQRKQQQGNKEKS